MRNKMKILDKLRQRRKKLTGNFLVEIELFQAGNFRWKYVRRCGVFHEHF